MCHRLHPHHITSSFEIDWFQMLSCQPSRTDDLFLVKQRELSSKSYTSQFILQVSPDIQSLWNVSHNHLVFSWNYSSRKIIVSPESNNIIFNNKKNFAFFTCCVRWWSKSIAPGKISGKFHSTPSQSNKNVSWLFSNDLALLSFKGVQRSLVAIWKYRALFP